MQTAFRTPIRPYRKSRVAWHRLSPRRIQGPKQESAGIRPCRKEERPETQKFSLAKVKVVVEAADAACWSCQMGTFDPRISPSE